MPDGGVFKTTTGPFYSGDTGDVRLDLDTLLQKEALSPAGRQFVEKLREKIYIHPRDSWQRTYVTLRS